MAREPKQTGLQNLPACAVEFINHIIKKMRYRRRVRRDVRAEFTAHFEDELRECATDEQRQQKSQELIAGFGDVKLLAVLLRRAKKRCRPLWCKILVRSFQAFGIVVAYFLICFSPLVIGRPNISVNYIDWLNDRVRADRPESENAYPYYEKAVEASVKMPEQMYEIHKMWAVDLNDVETGVLLQWINDNEKALDLLIEGTKKPYYWAVYEATGRGLSQGGLFDVGLLFVDAGHMKKLSGYRTLARALYCRSRYKAYKGDVESALADCVSLVRFGRHQEGKGLLTEQLVGVAIEAMAHEAILTVLEKSDVPAEVLKNIQPELREQFSEKPRVINLEAEKVFWYDYIQRSFTDDGEGGGRMLIRGMPLAAGDWQSGLWRFVSFSYPDRQEVRAMIDRYFNYTRQILEQKPWQLRQEGELQNLDEITKDCFLLQILAPAHHHMSKIIWRTKTMRAATLTLLAVLHYERDKSEYPESLQALVEAGYLKGLPKDPYGDGPLVYRKTEDNFTLYSVGVNLTDDGGQIVRDDKGRVKKWVDEGDHVFWPVAKSQTNG